MGGSQSTAESSAQGRQRRLAAFGEDTHDELIHQNYAAFSQLQRKWKRIRTTPLPLQSSPSPKSLQSDFHNHVPDHLTILSWNIDFMRPMANERMSAALSYLRNYISHCPANIVILLQEMVRSDLTLILKSSWVRSQFYVSDTTPENWRTAYGCVTLVDRRLSIRGIGRLAYASSQMGRDALFVDIPVPSDRARVLRIGNTHLESLRSDPPLRPLQLRGASNIMKAGDGVHSAFIAGDMNAIQPFDRSLVSACGLEDAFLLSGGSEDTQEGYTWGQMAHRNSRRMYGCCRMDKVLFVQREGEVRVKSFQRFGRDVVVQGEANRDRLEKMADLEMAWVTDHLGVRADFEIR